MFLCYGKKKHSMSVWLSFLWPSLLLSPGLPQCYPIRVCGCLGGRLRSCQWCLYLVQSLPSPLQTPWINATQDRSAQPESGQLKSNWHRVDGLRDGRRDAEDKARTNKQKETRTTADRGMTLKAGATNFGRWNLEENRPHCSFRLRLCYLVWKL